LALFFNEEHAHWAEKQLEDHRGELRMSTVNLAETLIRVKDLQPQGFENIQDQILESGIRFVPPTVIQSQIAAAARLEFPINLGDCFAYALAKDEGCPLLTLDRDFKKTDIPVIIP
jgi:ribonuclease VapC